MKKFFCVLTALVVLAGAGARADEGMWLLPLLQKMNAKALSEAGCKLSTEDIYAINHTSLKDAIVQFGGGCTGEIISRDGLLVTNHHCGYGSIQKLSSPEHNYLEDGFWAMNRGEEIPVPGLTVTFLERMTDVTKVIAAAAAKDRKAAEQNRKTDESSPAKPAATEEGKAKKALIEKAEKDFPGCTAQVTDFYNGNTWYLIVYKIYKDIRFVGAPPASLGKFGGDTDNWMWPRHTCDFSMFRVYAGADNQPAEYSPENKPLQPKRSLQISLKGTKDGDYAMIMGYPGRTQRFQTAAQLKKMLTLNDIRIDARTVRQGVIWDARMADPVINLKYASKYASSSNGWKKWQGMRQAFAKLGIIERQQQEEEAFASWAKAKKKRQAKYGDAISQLEDCCGATIEAEKAMTLLLETVYSIELVQLSRTPSEAAYSNYDPDVDRRVAKAVVEHYKKNVNPRDEIQLPDIDELFEKSVFTSLEKYKKAVADSVDLDADPARILRKSIVEKGQELSKTVATRSEQQQKAAKAFTAGMLEMNAGKPSYPDANFTMRLTYGHVLPYDPIDGVTYKSATTLTGVMEKWDPDNYEFRVPEKLRTIYAQKDFGGYANADGTMPACFLTNCDITGGNSGSPVLNADGQLIGLAFDGNWEAMSSDVMFEPNLQRCICVDIRYVLLILDKFGGAGYLLDEMDIVR